MRGNGETMNLNCWQAIFKKKKKQKKTEQGPSNEWGFPC